MRVSGRRPSSPVSRTRTPAGCLRSRCSIQHLRTAPPKRQSNSFFVRCPIACRPLAVTGLITVMFRCRRDRVSGRCPSRTASACRRGLFRCLIGRSVSAYSSFDSPAASEAVSEPVPPPSPKTAMEEMRAQLQPKCRQVDRARLPR